MATNCCNFDTLVFAQALVNLWRNHFCLGRSFDAAFDLWGGMVVCALTAQESNTGQQRMDPSCIEDHLLHQARAYDAPRFERIQSDEDRNWLVFLCNAQ